LVKATILPVDCDNAFIYTCAMKHISILALHDATMTSIDGSVQLFTRVNDFLAYQEKNPFYEIELIGLSGLTTLNNGLYNININKRIDEIKKTDLIIIPIICGDFKKNLEANKEFNAWVVEQYKLGSEIASLCVGTFFLASTGLLDGKKCAIHWASKNDFQAMFPKANVIHDVIMTEEDGIYTSGGAYSHLNLILHIIEKHLGREMSVLASKMFEIDIERKNQNQFAIFMGQKGHDDSDVLKAQEFIENNSSKKLTVDELCVKFGIGRRTFERRFKKSTGNSFVEYIQRVKVETVKRQLEGGRKTVNEIIFGVGYNDINAFREVFKKYAGISPIAYRKKYKA
jgi:transcriptional regulator GlxA family with amidase domain